LLVLPIHNPFSRVSAERGQRIKAGFAEIHRTPVTAGNTRKVTAQGLRGFWSSRSSRAILRLIVEIPLYDPV
jgi:hypothetical protein